MSRGGRDLDISNNERTFIINALKEGLRLDGRPVDGFRPVDISFGADYGTVHLSLGSTKVFTTVAAELVRPFPESPSEGMLLFSTEVSAVATAKRERTGRANEEELLVNRMLERCLRRSRAVDTEGLCILAGSKVWAIRATIRVLNNDGNLLDAVCMAAVAALSHFRRPDVSVVDDEVIVHPVSERTPLPLSVHYIPICTTFGLFRGMNTTLLDPTQTESRVQSGELTICLNNHREICTISKAGGVPVELNTLLRCGKIAAEKTSEVAEMIRKAVADDVKLKLDSAKRSESMHSGGDRNRPMG